MDRVLRSAPWLSCSTALVKRIALQLRYTLNMEQSLWLLQQIEADIDMRIEAMETSNKTYQNILGILEKRRADIAKCADLEEKAALLRDSLVKEEVFIDPMDAYLNDILLLAKQSKTSSTTSKNKIAPKKSSLLVNTTQSTRFSLSKDSSAINTSSLIKKEKKSSTFLQQSSQEASNSSISIQNEKIRKLDENMTRVIKRADDCKRVNILESLLPSRDTYFMQYVLLIKYSNSKNKDTAVILPPSNELFNVILNHFNYINFESKSNHNSKNSIIPYSIYKTYIDNYCLHHSTTNITTGMHALDLQYTENCKSNAQISTDTDRMSSIFIDWFILNYAVHQCTIKQQQFDKIPSTKYSKNGFKVDSKCDFLCEVWKSFPLCPNTSINTADSISSTVANASTSMYCNESADVFYDNMTTLVAYIIEQGVSNVELRRIMKELEVVYAVSAEKKDSNTDDLNASSCSGASCGGYDVWLDVLRVYKAVRELAVGNGGPQRVMFVEKESY